MKTEKCKNSNKNRNNKLYNENLCDLRHACIVNITSLLKEAELLYENEFYARTFLLSYLVLEELGKLLLISDYITGVVSEEELKVGFKDHNHKIGYWHNQCQLTKDNDGTTNATITYSKDKYRYLFNLRKKSAYVDYINEMYDFTTPQDTITSNIAVEILNYAKKEFNFLISCEIFNSRIGSKAIYK